MQLVLVNIVSFGFGPCKLFFKKNTHAKICLLKRSLAQLFRWVGMFQPTWHLLTVQFCHVAVHVIKNKKYENYFLKLKKSEKKHC